jgi:hypothetical protein
MIKIVSFLFVCDSFYEAVTSDYEDEIRTNGGVLGK